MTEVPRTVHTTPLEATPQTSARLSALRFALDSHARKEATRPGSPDDAERSLSDGAKDIIQDTK